MKKIIEIQSNNAVDIERIYDEYYNIKRDLEKNEFQTINVKIKIEIEVI